MAKDIQCDQNYVDMCNKRDMKVTEEWDKKVLETASEWNDKVLETAQEWDDILKAKLEETIREGDDATLTEAKEYTDEHSGTASDSPNYVIITYTTEFWDKITSGTGILFGSTGIEEQFITLCKWNGETGEVTLKYDDSHSMTYRLHYNQLFMCWGHDDGVNHDMRLIGAEIVE